MSDPLRIAVVGVTGLIGRAIIRQAIGREDMRLLGIARRESALPDGARMEMIVVDPNDWGDVLMQTKPDVLVSALGTTWSKAGKDEDAFRAVDHDLVVNTAAAAHRAGVGHLIAISSVGADAASKNFYLKVKGEAERELLRCGIKRVDIFRPGLLLGNRVDDTRVAEGIGRIVSPITNLLMQGGLRKYRAISDDLVAQGVLGLCKRQAAGKFIHDHDGIRRAANALPKIADAGD